MGEGGGGGRELEGEVGDRGWEIGGPIPSFPDRLVGLVVKASTSRAADLRFDSRFLRGDFSRSSHNYKDWRYSGHPAWRYRVRGSGWPGVSIL